MAGSDRKRPADTALDEAISTLTYIAVVAAVSWAVTHRDTVTRARMMVLSWWSRRSADPFAAEVAAFRRDIADISRGGGGPDTSREPGLYERGTP